jgi:hypothetical protein
MTAAALAEEAGVAPDGLRRLEQKGWITLGKGVIRRNPHGRMTVLPTFAPPLMDEQRRRWRPSARKWPRPSRAWCCCTA